MTAENFSTKVDKTGGGPNMTVRSWALWMWRQLTSMRVAMLLLLLLAIATLPGAFIPQRNQDPSGVADYFNENPGMAEWLDRLWMFDVYGSPWFQTVYVLLFVSLVGCIVPRIGVHVRALRSQPPKVPRRLTRFVGHRHEPTDLTLAEATTAATKSLRAYRTKVTETANGADIAAERGYLRETGNIVFHLSLLGLLLAFGASQLVSHRAQAVVVEGETFANSVVDFDTYEPGRWVDENNLTPYTVGLDSFSSEFTVDSQARDFTAEVTVSDAEGSYQDDIKVNHPMNVAGTNIYLAGNGFAPRITVTDANGDVAFSQPVPFLPQDEVYTSRGVVKVPDVGDGLEQFGFSGTFFPTVGWTEAGSPVSLHPQPNEPMLVLSMWVGDLGLDDGVPQNVYVLDTTDMEQVTVPLDEAVVNLPPEAITDGDFLIGGDDQVDDDTEVPYTLFLAPGATVELPDGLGTITFEDMPRFAALDLRYDPTLPWLLAAAIGVVVGIFGSLFIPRRRVWVRLTSDDDADDGSGGGRVTAEVAGLARGDDAGLPGDVAKVARAVGLPEPDNSVTDKGAGRRDSG